MRKFSIEPKTDPGLNFTETKEDYLTKSKSSFAVNEVKSGMTQELLKTVKTTMATGHDGISNRILKRSDMVSLFH